MLILNESLSSSHFWSALIRLLPHFRRVLFPNCSQVHFHRKLLIFDLRSGHFSIVLFRGCGELFDRNIGRRFMGTN